jgi:hypothetical protein
MKLTIAELIVKTLAVAGVNSTCCGQPELNVAGLLIPWITIVGALGFLAAWLAAAILERTALSRHVWHLPLFFLALVVLFGALIGSVFFP